MDKFPVKLIQWKYLINFAILCFNRDWNRVAI